MLTDKDLQELIDERHADYVAEAWRESYRHSEQCDSLYQATMLVWDLLRDGYECSMCENTFTVYYWRVS